MAPMRQLYMHYAGGGIVRHLGLQNYRGPVPALAELVANAWDADAEKVELEIPFDRPFTPEDRVIIKDDGFGMNWVDCNEKYLVIGRNRRDVEKTDTTPKGRPLMAHKGLGKLAGFGIAKTMEIRTVKKGKLTHFEMSFNDLDQLKQGDNYPPNMISDEEPAAESDGTIIILKDLKLQRAISKEQFVSSMSRKFSIFSDKFKLFINNELLEKRDIPLEFRFPEEGDKDIKFIEDRIGVTDIGDGLEIKWWMGFTEDPIKNIDFNGVSIIARGRMAQDPGTFDLAGATWGQHGLRYLTGEIIADFVDEGRSYENDTILTNRNGLNLENSANRKLYEWARTKISNSLRIWSERRGQKNIEKVKEKYPEIDKKIKEFAPREQKELNTAIKSIAQIPDIELEKVKNISEHIIDGYRDKVFSDLIRDVTNLPPENMAKTIDVLMEFDVFEAVRVHNIVVSHIQVIKRFEQMIREGVREKPDMHEYIKKYPWLLGIKLQTLDYENTLQEIIEKKYGIKKPEAEGDDRRPDFVCMRSGLDVVIIELKRPKDNIGMTEIQQIMDYVYYLRKWVGEGTHEREVGIKLDKDRISGYLIAYNVQDNPTVEGQIAMLEKDKIYVSKWYEVLIKAEEDHKEFRNMVKRRAPTDDPRIKEIEKL